MTFEQWIQSPEGQLAMSYLHVNSREIQSTALHLAFVAGEMAAEKDAHERLERILQASPPTTDEPLIGDKLVVAPCEPLTRQLGV